MSLSLYIYIYIVTTDKECGHGTRLGASSRESRVYGGPPNCQSRSCIRDCNRTLMWSQQPRGRKAS